ncbi:MAG: pyruvate carboxylase subunit B, partial [Planctomycetota bacterium]
SYTVSPIHTIPAYVDLAKRLQDLAVDSICIKDMAALLKPQAAFDLVSAIKQACGADLPVHIHAHATTGVTLVSLMKAIEAGADGVDTAISSMSLGTGHNPTESLCEMLTDTGYGTTVDLERLTPVKRHFAAVRSRYQAFATRFQGADTAIFTSQIPGGMLSNMESQLRAQGAEDRLDEVLAEVPIVRREAGYPPLVTPSSQIVGSQAVLNVLLGRYERMTGEFQDLVLGYYGATRGVVDPELLRRAGEAAGKTAISCRPADRIEAEWQRLASEAQRLSGFAGSDEDILTYALFPQVAATFFSERTQGPRDLGHERDISAPRPAQPPPTTSNDGPRTYTVTVDGHDYQVRVAPGGEVEQVTAPSSTTVTPPAAASGEIVAAELAGTVLRVPVQVGDRVKEGAILVILEAMKMETQITAPRAGTVAAIAVTVGDQVSVGANLVTLT